MVIFDAACNSEAGRDRRPLDAQYPDRTEQTQASRGSPFPRGNPQYATQEFSATNGQLGETEKAGAIQVLRHGFNGFNTTISKEQNGPAHRSAPALTAFTPICFRVERTLGAIEDSGKLRRLEMHNPVRCGLSMFTAKAVDRGIYLDKLGIPKF